MLVLIGSGTAIACLIFLGLFIWSLIDKCLDGWKEVIVFTLISTICLGLAFFIESFTYEETIVNEYEVVYVGEDTFSYKTEDGGISDKYKWNCKVYKSDDDRAYAVETVTTVKSKINEFVHSLLTFNRELGDQEIAYKIYLPEEKYQEYISR